MTRKGIQGLSIIFESPVTLAATGIWIPFGSPLPVILVAAGICISFGSLLPVILVATGIQSPFPHPTWFVSAGVCSTWDVNPSTRRVLVGITVLAHDQGSGFPLRRE